MNAKKITKRVVAIVLTVMMALTCFVLPSVMVQAADPTIVNIHYLRDDGSYGEWDVWAWADGLDGAGVREEVGVEIVKLHRVTGVVHDGEVLRLRHVSAFALLLVGVCDSSVFSGNPAGFSRGEIAFGFLFCHLDSPLSASSSGQRHPEVRLRRG